MAVGKVRSRLAEPVTLGSAGSKRPGHSRKMFATRQGLRMVCTPCFSPGAGRGGIEQPIGRLAGEHARLFHGMLVT